MNIIMVTTSTDVYAPTVQPSAICVHDHDHVTYASHKPHHVYGVKLVSHGWKHARGSASSPNG